MSNADVQDKPEDAVEPIEKAASPKTNGDDEEPVRSPLSPEEFRAVLEQIDSLGLTWTAEIPPRVKFKDPKSRHPMFSDELNKIQETYPTFPTELGNVIFYALTGGGAMPSVIGSTDDAEKKKDAVRALLIEPRPEFRSEFFFKYAIKVPYFVDLDWEVVIKAFERNVREMPRIPYALLSLVFRQPTDPTLPIDVESVQREKITVAVNEYLVNILIQSLEEVRIRLQKAATIADSLSGNQEINHATDKID